MSSTLGDTDTAGCEGTRGRPKFELKLTWVETAQLTVCESVGVGGYLIVSVLRHVRGRADGGAGAGGQDGGPAWRDVV